MKYPGLWNMFYPNYTTAIEVRKQKLDGEPGV
uniref:Uncharacterized protein n=1 Tax=Anguilla anguilla TaxID=7936 RepID=A0A0E9XNX0_ANGAN